MTPPADHQRNDDPHDPRVAPDEEDRDRQPEAENDVVRLPGQIYRHPLGEVRCQLVRDHVRQRGEHRRGRQHLQQRVEAVSQGVDLEGLGAGHREQPGRERVENDHQQPETVDRPQPRIHPPDVPEDVVMIPPRRGDHEEADQEGRVVTALVPDRSPEFGNRVPFRHRQVDGEQRDRDRDHRIREQGQPVRRAGVVVDLVFWHPPIILRAQVAASGGTLNGVTTWMGAGAVTIGPSSAPCACMMIWQPRCMSRRRSW